MSGERYWITANGYRVALPGTFRPSTLSPRTVSYNLVRARGYTEVYDLSDGLPDPAPLVLVGEMEAATEAALAADLETWAAHVRDATSVDRDGRRPMVCRGGSLVAVPADESDSTRATVTITLILASVPTAGTHFF